MALNIAMSCKGDTAFLFAGQIGPGGRSTLTDVRTLPIPKAPLKTEEQDTASEDDSDDAEPVPEEEQNTEFPRLDLEEIFKTEVNSAVALIKTDKVLFEKISLPFNEPKHVEKILPLQIQDKIPFDVDDFIVDSYFIGEGEKNKYEHLSSFVPKKIVSSTLQTYASIGLEPSLITNNSFALAGIPSLAPEAFPDAYAIIDIQSTYSSLLVVYDEKIFAMRELSGTASSNASPAAIFNTLISDIRCSLAQAEADSEKPFQKIFLVGNQEAARAFSSQTPYQSMYLDLNSLRPNNLSGIDLNEFPGVLGLLAHEAKIVGHNTGEINFRQGEFSYKPALRNILLSLREHFWNIISVIVMGLTLLFSHYLLEWAQLKSIERKTAQAISSKLPGEFFLKGQEVNELNSKVGSLETQLQDMGSLSSLTPLEALKELSLIFPKSIDTKINLLVISDNQIKMVGTVPDVKFVGKLDTILKSNKRFCSNPNAKEPTANNEGKDGGRTKFSANIPLCE